MWKVSRVTTLPRTTGEGEAELWVIERFTERLRRVLVLVVLVMRVQVVVFERLVDVLVLMALSEVQPDCPQLSAFKSLSSSVHMLLIRPNQSARSCVIGASKLRNTLRAAAPAPSKNCRLCVAVPSM